MKYDVLDCFIVGTNTSVSISGNGKSLKNGVYIKSAEGVIFKVLSVAMYSGVHSDADKTTTFLVEGKLETKSIEVI